jgi:hypothetical protein
MHFDGKDDSLYVPGTGSVLNITGQTLSVEAWMRIPSYPATSYAVLGTHGYSSGYRLVIRNTGSMGLQIGKKAGGRTYVCGGRIYPNNWHHVAVTYDATLPSGNVKFYLDGLLDTTLDGSDPILLSTGPFVIGVSGGVPHFPGDLDEIRVSRIARAPEDLSVSPVSSYFRSGHIVSPKINKAGREVTNVTLDWRNEIPEKGSMRFFVTNDGGGTWHDVRGKNRPFVFPGKGADLRIKAVLQRGYGTPVLHEWEAAYGVIE